MGRSRYTITETDKPHFLTCTIMEWLPLFIRPYIVDHLLNCWRYQQTHQNLKLYGYVILENHLHFVAEAPDLNKCLSQFKSFNVAPTHLYQVLKEMHQRLSCKTQIVTLGYKNLEEVVRILLALVTDHAYPTRVL